MTVGKNDKGMPKSRENTNESSFGISPVESQGKLTQAVHDMDNQEYFVEHVHDWYFATEVTKRDKWGDYAYTLSKFVCLCGAVKRVKQFEVEE